MVSSEDGHVAMHAGARVAGRLALAPGTVLELEGVGPSVARVALSEAGLVFAVGAGESERRMVLSPRGLLVDGDVIVTGKVVQG